MWMLPLVAPVVSIWLKWGLKLSRFWGLYLKYKYTFGKIVSHLMLLESSFDFGKCLKQETQTTTVCVLKYF